MIEKEVNMVDTLEPSQANPYAEGGLENARLGVLYLFAKSNRDSYVLTAMDSALAMAVPTYAFYGEQVKLAADPGAGALFAHQPPTMANVAGREVNVQTIEKTIVKLFLEGVRSCIAVLEFWRKTPPHDESLADRIMAYAKTGLLGDLAHLAEKVAKTVAKSIIPLFKSTYELHEALAASVARARDRYRIYVAGKGVAIREGFPRLTVDGVKSGLNGALWTSLLKSLSHAGLFILDVASLVGSATLGVAQSIFGMATSMVEEIARTALKLYEIHVTDRFMKEAKAYYGKAASNDSIHRRPEAFDAWYGAAVERVPAIAAYTLASGICGDKMRLLRMVDSKGSAMTQAQYDKAFAYLELVGKEAAGVMKQGVVIRSTDPTVHALFHRPRRTYNEDGDAHLAARLATRMSSASPGVPSAKTSGSPGLWTAAIAGQAGKELARRYRKSIRAGHVRPSS